jgi:hypothetical protein
MTSLLCTSTPAGTGSVAPRNHTHTNALEGVGLEIIINRSFGFAHARGQKCQTFSPSADEFSQFTAISTKQLDPEKCGDLKGDAKRDRWITLFNAIQRPFSDTGTRR